MEIFLDDIHSPLEVYKTDISFLNTSQLLNESCMHIFHVVICKCCLEKLDDEKCLTTLPIHEAIQEHLQSVVVHLTRAFPDLVNPTITCKVLKQECHTCGVLVHGIVSTSLHL